VRNRDRYDFADQPSKARTIHFDYGKLGHLALAILARRPADSIGILAATLAATAILVNALFLQPRAHPAPIFAPRARPAVTSGETTGAVTPSLPRPRPAEATRNAEPARNAEPVATPRNKAEIVADIQRELSRRGFYDGPTDGVHGARTDAAIRDFAQHAGFKITNEQPQAVLRAIMQSPLKATAAKAPTPPNAVAARPNDQIAALLAPSKKILAVQRALGDYGYGQMVPTGVMDAGTKAAIERFERERKLPVTGQVSDRLLRELAATTGRPLE
jgi:peptidoglycan hydrolase-like protein with peptidoglycan-binding domain